MTPSLPPRCDGCRCSDAAPANPRAASVAHGQPGDPSALQPDLERLAAAVTAQLDGIRVAGATLACPRSLARLRGIGAVYPLFMADGWFVRSEMPRRLAAAGVEGFAVLPPLGLDPALPGIGAEVAREAGSPWQPRDGGRGFAALRELMIETTADAIETHIDADALLGLAR